MSNAYKRFQKTPSATIPLIVLTVPAATAAIVKSIWIANIGVSSTNITVTFAPDGAGTHYIVPLESVAPKQICRPLGRLERGPFGA